jgi:hypothetical protein
MESSLSEWELWPLPGPSRHSRLSPAQSKDHAGFEPIQRSLQDPGGAWRAMTIPGGATQARAIWTVASSLKDVEHC